MSDHHGCRALASAVLMRAIKDAHSWGKGSKKDRVAARRFLRPTNPVYQFYCDALDLDPQALMDAAIAHGPAWMKRFGRGSPAR